MKKSRLTVWLEALRSDKYIKNRGALRKDNTFCPLGILCDISGTGSWELDPYSKKMSYLGQVNYLPKEVAEWAGMTRDESVAVTAFLIAFNDYEKISLLEIADLLEKKYSVKKH